MRRGRIWVWRGLRRMVCQLLSIYNPPFAAVIRASDFSRIAYLKFRALSHTHAQVPYVGMTFVSLDSIHHYQPPSSAFQPVQRRSASSKRRASTVSSTHKDYEAGAPKVALGVRFEDFDMTEYIDLTASPPTDLFDRSREPVVECGSQESNVNGNVFGPPYRREFE